MVFQSGSGTGIRISAVVARGTGVAALSLFFNTGKSGIGFEKLIDGVFGSHHRNARIVIVVHFLRFNLASDATASNKSVD